MFCAFNRVTKIVVLYLYLSLMCSVMFNSWCNEYLAGYETICQAMTGYFVFRTQIFRFTYTLSKGSSVNLFDRSIWLYVMLFVKECKILSSNYYRNVNFANVFSKFENHPILMINQRSLKLVKGSAVKLFVLIVEFWDIYLLADINLPDFHPVLTFLIGIIRYQYQYLILYQLAKSIYWLFVTIAIFTSSLIHHLSIFYLRSRAL